MSYYCAHCRSFNGKIQRWGETVWFHCSVCGKTTKFLIDDVITVDLRKKRVQDKPHKVRIWEYNYNPDDPRPMYPDLL